MLLAQTKQLYSVNFQYYFDDWEDTYLTYRFEYDEDGKLEYAYTVDYEDGVTNRYVYLYNEDGQLIPVEHQDRYLPKEQITGGLRNGNMHITTNK